MQNGVHRGTIYGELPTNLRKRMQKEAQTSALSFRVELSVFEVLHFMGKQTNNLGRGCRRVHGLSGVLIDQIRCNRGTVRGEITWGAEEVLHSRSSRKSRRTVWCRVVLREEYWAPHTPQSFMYMLTRTSTDRVGENVTGCSLDKTVGSDLRKTCGRLGDAGRHAGAQTAFEHGLLPIGDCKIVRMETFLMCGNAIRQGDDQAPPSARAGEKCMKQNALSFAICKNISMTRSLECWERLQDVSKLDGSIWVGNDNDVQTMDDRMGQATLRFKRHVILMSVEGDAKKVCCSAISVSTVGNIKAACSGDLQPALSVYDGSGGPSRANSKHLKGVFRVPERHGNRTGSVRPGWPVLGAKAAERSRVTRKFAPRAVKYQGQYLSCEWVIEASTPKPRDPTHGTRYRVVGRRRTVGKL
ncbi:UNVERIFIED_CONTAM: hypothetical protein Sindi_2680100, partial [Sesamum indicum]